MSLTLITGPMFSGKTSYLLSAINKYAIVKKRVLCVNHSFDKRYDPEGKIHSHDGKSVYITEKNKDYIKQISTDKIKDVLLNEDLSCYSAVFIDEGHFFNDIYEVMEIVEMKKNVYISFLNSDYRMCSFNVMDPFYSKADKIVHLVAVCNVCGADAPFTTRLMSGDCNQILVGADDVYEPRCRSCFNI
jgi:thymidine kinase